MNKKEYIVHCSMVSSRDIDSLEITKAISNIKDVEITGFSIETIAKPIVIQQVDPIEDAIYSVNGEPHKLSHIDNDYIELISSWTNKDIRIASSMWSTLVDSNNIVPYKEISINSNVSLRESITVNENVLESTPEGRFAYLKIIANSGTPGKIVSIDNKDHTAVVAFNCDIPCNAFDVQTGDNCVRLYSLQEATIPLDNLIAE